MVFSSQRSAQYLQEITPFRWYHFQYIGASSDSPQHV